MNIDRILAARRPAVTCSTCGRPDCPLLRQARASHSSLLRPEKRIPDSPMPMPRVATLGMDFGGDDPVLWVSNLLKERRIADPEELRKMFDFPAGRLHCYAAPAPRRLHVRAAEAHDVLYQALLLGLCTDVLYDPARPVLWTTASLTRALELCSLEGFYDAD